MMKFRLACEHTYVAGQSAQAPAALLASQPSTLLASSGGLEQADDVFVTCLHLCSQAADHACVASQSAQAFAALPASHALYFSGGPEQTDDLFASCLQAAPHAYAATHSAQAPAALLASQPCTLPAMLHILLHIINTVQCTRLLLVDISPSQQNISHMLQHNLHKH